MLQKHLYLMNCLYLFNLMFREKLPGATPVTKVFEDSEMTVERGACVDTVGDIDDIRLD
jgi:hypothetical protein